MTNERTNEPTNHLHVVKLVKTSPTFYATTRFITVFKTARRLSWDRQTDRPLQSLDSPSPAVRGNVIFVTYACVGDERCVQAVIRKKSLERHRLRWQDDIKTYSKEMGWEVADRIHLAQGSKQRRAVVKTGMNCKRNFLTSCSLIKKGFVVWS